MITRTIGFGIYSIAWLWYRFWYLVSRIWSHKFDVFTGYTAFFIAGIIHEFGHGVGNWLTGGDTGLFCPACGGSDRIIGGYGINSWFMGLVPVFSIRVAEYGDRLVMLLAGPLSVVFLAWIVGLRWNLESIRTRQGDTMAIWKRRRGIVYGLLLRGWFDAIYLLPIDPFPDQPAHGDGMGIYNQFKDQGWHYYEPIDILGVETQFMFNPGYLIGGAAILGMLYVTYRVVKCSPLLCRVCRVT